MAYALGVDLGTTYTAAATFSDGRVEIASLGNRAASIPSVVLLREDEEILTGDAANRRGTTEPTRLAREFKRRVGDTTPLFLGGSPYSAEQLMGRLLSWVTAEAAKLEGGPADHLAISHPANWGPYKKDLLAQAVRMADLADATFLSEPEAAAIHYASQSRVDIGDVIAVYDLGGGTFDAAVLRKTGNDFDMLGEPEGIERLGGIDFDAAVFAHVARNLDGKLDELDEQDPHALATMARLRQECVDAKEALSTDTDVSISVTLPNVQTEIRLTRAEFESMVRPALGDSIGALRRALASAEVEPVDVSAILLVGGSSRIPLVAQMVGAELGRPVAVDAHPKHAVALGAALAAAQTGGMPGAAPAPTESSPSEDAGPTAAPAVVGGPAFVDILNGADAATPAPAAAAAAGAAAGAMAADVTLVSAELPPPAQPSSTAEFVGVGALPGSTIPPGLAPPGAAGPGDERSSGLPSWAIVGGILLLVLLVAGGTFLLTSGGDGGGDEQAAPAVTTARVSSETTVAVTSPPAATIAVTAPPATLAPEPAAPSLPSDASECASGLFVNSNTSCPFAANVRDAYLSTGSSTVEAFSPATGRTFTMTCETTASFVVCRGGDDAAVYIV